MRRQHTAMLSACQLHTEILTDVSAAFATRKGEVVPLPGLLQYDTYYHNRFLVHKLKLKHKKV